MTMTEVYRQTIVGPPVAPPRHSLIGALTTVDEPGVRWEGGYTFVSELGPTHAAEVLDGCLSWEPTTLEGGPHAVTVDPVALWASDDCTTTLGTRTRDWQGQVRRKLNAYGSFDLARHVWANVLAPWVSTSGGSVDRSPAAALGKLEEALGLALQGVLGTVWCQPTALTALVAAGAIRLDGARYVTPMGHPVVADAGFGGYPPDTASPGGSQAEDFWMVGTGPARVRLGPIEVTDPTSIAGIDPTRNTVAVTAWRVAAVEVEPLVWHDPIQGGGTVEPPYAEAYAITGAEPA